GRTGAERLPSGANELLYRGHWTVYVGRRTDPGREGTGRVARAGPLSSPGRTSTTAFPHYHPRARPVSSARGPARPRARRLSSSRGPSFLRPLLSFHPRRFTTRLPRGGGASGGARASRAAARPRTRPHPGSSKPTPPFTLRSRSGLPPVSLLSIPLGRVPCGAHLGSGLHCAPGCRLTTLPSASRPELGRSRHGNARARFLSPSPRRRGERGEGDDIVAARSGRDASARVTTPSSRSNGSTMR